MSGRAVVLGLLIPALVAPIAEARTSKEPAIDRALAPDVDDMTLAIARIANLWSFDLVPHAFVDRMVRWQVGLRDVMRGTANRLAALVQDTGFRAPDLTTLTTFPLPSSNDSWATSGFGWRDDPLRHRAKFHPGADIRARPGTPVFAAGDGVVVFAGRRGGYGNVVMVDHGGGVITRYAHLRRIHATAGEVITSGTRIGQVGSTGRATGPHLHFEVRLDGNPVDPDVALSVARLQREAPEQGKIAAFALSPELQTHSTSNLDPPKSRKARKRTESRPDRPGRVKRVRPVS